MTKQDEKKQDDQTPDTAPSETPGHVTGPDAQTPSDAPETPVPVEAKDAAPDGSQGDSGPDEAPDETPSKKAARQRAQAAEGRVSELEARVTELEALLDGARRTVASGMASTSTDPFKPALANGDAIFDVGQVATGDLVNDSGAVDPALVAEVVTRILESYPQLQARAKGPRIPGSGEQMSIQSGGNDKWQQLLSRRGR